MDGAGRSGAGRAPTPHPSMGVLSVRAKMCRKRPAPPSAQVPALLGAPPPPRRADAALPTAPIAVPCPHQMSCPSIPLCVRLCQPRGREGGWQQGADPKLCLQWTVPGQSGASGRSVGPNAPTGAAASARSQRRATEAGIVMAPSWTPATAPLSSAPTVSTVGMTGLSPRERGPGGGHMC